MKKIKKGDEVIVLTGKDKGRRGMVLSCTHSRIVVEGINRAKKHVKPNPTKGETGGIIERDMPIHISNVALYNPGANKGERVGIKTLEDGRKVRFFRTSGQQVEA